MKVQKALSNAARSSGHLESPFGRERLCEMDDLGDWTMRSSSQLEVMALARKFASDNESSFLPFTGRGVDMWKEKGRVDQRRGQPSAPDRNGKQRLSPVSLEGGCSHTTKCIAMVLLCIIRLNWRQRSVPLAYLPSVSEALRFCSLSSGVPKCCAV